MASRQKEFVQVSVEVVQGKTAIAEITVVGELLARRGLLGVSLSTMKSVGIKWFNIDCEFYEWNTEIMGFPSFKRVFLVS